jgi:hypothetical protein
MIDSSYKEDTRQIRYTPPSSAVAAFMQLPGYRMTYEAAADAYMKDWRAARRASKKDDV